MNDFEPIIEKGDLVELFKRQDRMRIPRFQRDYAWNRNNCGKFYEDFSNIVIENRIAGQNRKSSQNWHFFGSLVFKQEGRSIEIIDGQQRIISVFLFLLALRNLVLSGEIELVDMVPQDAVQSLNKLLFIKGVPERRNLKLHLRQGDDEDLGRLILESAERAKEFESSLRIDRGEGRIIGNYEYFKNVLKDAWPDGRGFGIMEMEEALSRFVFSLISVKTTKMAQQIFESLNSTGEVLEEGEKIRNFIYMCLNESKHGDSLSVKWEEVEERVKGKLTEFLECHVVSRTGKITKKADFYYVFKKYVSANGIERVVEDLWEAKDRWVCMNPLFYGIGDDFLRKSYGRRIGDSLRDLEAMNASSINPFVMRVLEMRKDGISKSGEDAIYDVLHLVETYLLRRAVCNMKSNVHNKLFAGLYNRTCQKMGVVSIGAGGASENVAARAEINPEVFISSFRKVMALLKENAKLPTDEEFEEGFKNLDVYLMEPGKRLYIMRNLVVSGEYPIADFYARCKNTNDISIEHILPQNPQAKIAMKLKGEHGKNWREFHNSKIHKMGNLTMTALNSSMGNKEFKEKLDIGFNGSMYGENRSLGQLEGFDYDAIDERTRKFADKAMEVWGLGFDLGQFRDGIQQDTEWVDFDPDFDFNNTTLLEYKFRSNRSIKFDNGRAVSWASMTLEVVKTLSRDFPNEISRAIGRHTGKSKSWKGLAQKASLNDKSYTVIADGIYLRGPQSTMANIATIQTLYDVCGIDPSSELSFKIEYNDDDADSEALGHDGDSTGAADEALEMRVVVESGEESLEIDNPQDEAVDGEDLENEAFENENLEDEPEDSETDEDDIGFSYDMLVQDYGLEQSPSGFLLIDMEGFQKLQTEKYESGREKPRKIEGFVLNGREFFMTRWADILQALLLELNKTDPERMRRYVDESVNDKRLSRLFYRDEDELKGRNVMYRVLKEMNCCIYTNTSTKAKIEQISEILDRFGIDLDNFKIMLEK